MPTNRSSYIKMNVVVLGAMVLTGIAFTFYNCQQVAAHLAARSVRYELEQLRNVLKTVAAVPGGYELYCEKVSGPGAFAAPYSAAQVSAKNTLIAYRNRYGYSGYSFEMLLIAGRATESSALFIDYEYNINGKTYRYQQDRNRL